MPLKRQNNGINPLELDIFAEERGETVGLPGVDYFVWCCQMVCIPIIQR